MNRNRIISDQSKTMLTITVGLIVIFLLTESQIVLFFTLTIGLIGVISKRLSRLIVHLWMKLAWLLSLIVPNILLTIVFYIILTPTAVLSRIFNKNLDLRNRKNSYFRSISKEYAPEDFKKPW